MTSIYAPNLTVTTKPIRMMITIFSKGVNFEDCHGCQIQLHGEKEFNKLPVHSFSDKNKYLF